MTERGSSYEEKYLIEDEISMELLVATLSDVPDDADSDSYNRWTCVKRKCIGKVRLNGRL
jgi:hypothetical protein